ncbi:acyl-CoA dehydrogenase [Sphingomonas sp. TX0543]|uniref:acyl-CoA dehydrogenase n=1 Tax=Sphingomonas sp. TX0543 TaxID=3399682 RepID=UPI003AFB616E
MTYIVDRRNLDFVLFEMLGIESLLATEHYAHCDRPMVAQLLDTAQRLAEERYLPVAAQLDACPPALVGGEIDILPAVRTALTAYAEAGFAAQNFSMRDGGLQLPHTVAMAAVGMFIAANQGISNYSTLTSAAAHLLLEFGTDDQRIHFAPPLIAGLWGGTMCLSEPQAGSSLADITTKAVPAEDGTYHIRGTKMWISGAAHRMTENIVNLVLAKIRGAPAGVNGISLFIVPQRLVDAAGTVTADNNITLVGLNHKMGQRGTTNTMLNFGEAGPTTGYLIGQPNQGLRYMFHMMNEARIAVGHMAVMSGLAGYLYSRDYARERVQGRRLGHKDLTTPQVPLIAHPDIRRMLLAQKTCVEGGLALSHFCALLVDQQAIVHGAAREDIGVLLEVLTPIAKSWPSEHCLEANKLAIQVLGGAGYTLDHPVERFYRDNRLNHIHEGTFGIQGLDLLGRKVRLADGRGLALLVARIEETIAAATAVMSLTAFAAALANALDNLKRATAAATSEADAERGLANATLYLDAAGTIVVAWLWLWQAIVATTALETADSERAFYEAKLAACRYCFNYMLPTAQHQLTVVEALDDTCYAFTADQIGVAA